LYDLFESVASELWPDTAVAEASDEEGHDDSDDGAIGDEVEEDFEKQVAKELAAIKRPRKEQQFANCQTNTPCGARINDTPFPQLPRAPRDDALIAE